MIRMIEKYGEGEGWRRMEDEEVGGKGVMEQYYGDQNGSNFNTPFSMDFNTQLEFWGRISGVKFQYVYILLVYLSILK